MKLENIYHQIPYKSVKHSTYFNVYEDLLRQYRDRNITFVEIGVFGGGSLFMWRDFFGPKARIIGIDYNPNAKILEKEGFEIFIGDQSSTIFWEEFYKTIGNIDILLDDGAHRYSHQIETILNSENNINDGGMIIIEDTHTSYMIEFGPTKSKNFIVWMLDYINGINYRYGGFNHPTPNLNAYSVEFFESFVAIKINRKKAIISHPTDNDKKPYYENPVDYRYGSKKSRVSFKKNKNKFPKFLIIVAKKIYLISSISSRKIRNLLANKKVFKQIYPFKKY